MYSKKEAVKRGKAAVYRCVQASNRAENVSIAYEGSFMGETTRDMLV